MLSCEINHFKWKGIYLYAGIDSTFSDLFKIFIDFVMISQNQSNILLAVCWKVTIHP